MYPIIVFDLDDTLTESKQPLTSRMADLLAKLLDERKVAVISGASLPQLITQVVAKLPLHANLTNLYLLPTTGAALFTHREDAWKEVYTEKLTEGEMRTIATVIRNAGQETGLIDFTEQSWGERIEFRSAQVTVSGLGQHAPIEAKRVWDPDHTKRFKLQALIAPKLPEFSVKIAGATSIDITKKGIDKAYGVRRLSEVVRVPISSMLYIGDALFQGGNDEVVKGTGILTKEVSGPTDTEKIIEDILTDASVAPNE
jgi:HAD superfamily hydrolase (TIGR01484 family)